MSHVETVDVLESENEASKVLSSKFFSQSVSVDDQVKQLAALCKLHDQVQLVFGLDDFVELNDVGMSHCF